jgi:hypothetical protein
MARKDEVHVLPCDEGWSVELEGSSRTFSKHRTQAAAVKAGRDIARKNEAELLIHRRDGKIRDRRAYGAVTSPAAGGGLPS